jgi:hypothetical protein
MQQMAQKMNSLAVNACQIDRGIFTSGNEPATLSEAANNVFSGLSAAAGTVSSWFDGLFGNGNPKNNNDPIPAAKGTIDAANQASGSKSPAPTVEQMTFIGNSTWKGIVSNSVMQYFNPNNPSDAVSAEILMSVIGTTITELAPTNGTPTTSSDGPTSAGGPGVSGGQKVPPNITLKDLVEGDPGKPFLQCAATTIGSQAYPATGGSGSLDPTACRQVVSNTATTLGSVGYLGVDAQVNCAVMGVSGNANQNCPANSGPGIVAEIQTGNPSSNWTAAEKAIYAQSPIPFVSLMVRVGHNPAFQQTIASYALPYVKANVAANLGIALRNAMQQTFQNGGEKTYSLPPGYETTMLQLSSDTNVYVKQLQGAITASNELFRAVEGYLKTLAPHLPGQ